MVNLFMMFLLLVKTKSKSLKQLEEIIESSVERLILQVDTIRTDGGGGGGGTSSGTATISYAHEAGYDAFLTGIFFLTFKNMLGEKDFDKKYLNKLNLMNTYFSLNFDGNDPIISNVIIIIFFMLIIN